jgi:hypothetical protein
VEGVEGVESEGIDLKRVALDGLGGDGRTRALLAA